MRTDPGPEKLWNGEGDEEIGNRKQEAGSLTCQPLVPVDLPAERTMAVVAGVESKVDMTAVLASKDPAS